MIEGIDGASVAGIPNCTEVAAKGYRFGIPRLAFGHVRDHAAKEYLWRLRAAGMIARSGYGYNRSWEDGRSQADFQTAVARELGASFLWVDIEPAKGQRSDDGTWPVATDAPHLARPVTIARLERQRDLGLPFGVYGGPWYLGLLDLPAWVGERPLWLSHYGVTVPTVPRPWKGYAIWQREANVTLAGAKVDINETPLTEEQLVSLFEGAPLPYDILAPVLRAVDAAAGTDGSAERFVTRDEGPQIE